MGAGKPQAMLAMIKMQNKLQRLKSKYIQQVDENSDISLLKTQILDPQPWLEGSYKIRSVHLSFCSSFCLSVSFLGIGLLVFSETQHGVRVCVQFCVTELYFLGKNSHRAKMTNNGQKWPKNRVFGLFKKIQVICLIWNLCKTKVFMVH